MLTGVLSRTFVAVTAFGALLTWSLQSSAGTVTAGTYRLFDHPDGNLYATFPYGLRLDANDPTGPGLWSVSDANTGNPDFTQGSVFLTWDGSTGAAATATIAGTLVADDNTIWTVDYVVANISTIATGFAAATGSGTLTLTTGLMTVIDLEGKSGTCGTTVISGAFCFLADGHRTADHPPLDGDTIVGRGWLTGPMDTTNDWLVTASVVPLPAAAWLFGSALTGLGLIRRRRAGIANSNYSKSLA